jgi:hypothetical protein
MVLRKGRPTARVRGRPIGDHVVGNNCGLLDNPSQSQFQAICTAVPVGRQWRVKGVSASGDVNSASSFAASIWMNRIVLLPRWMRSSASAHVWRGQRGQRHDRSQSRRRHRKAVLA